jgi:hypothetical protein
MPIDALPIVNDPNGSAGGTTTSSVVEKVVPSGPVTTVPAGTVSSAVEGFVNNIAPDDVPSGSLREPVVGMVAE